MVIHKGNGNKRGSRIGLLDRIERTLPAHQQTNYTGGAYHNGCARNPADPSKPFTETGCFDCPFELCKLKTRV